MLILTLNILLTSSLLYLQYLDKVEVEMRTCEEPRPPNGQSPIALAAGQRLASPNSIVSF